MDLAEVPGAGIRELAPEHTYDRNVLQQEPVYLYRRNAPAGEPDHQEAAFRRDAFGGEIEDISSHRVENDIGAAALRQLADLFGPIVLAVVHGACGALTEGEIELGRLARSCDDSRAERFPNLDGSHAHSACAGMHQ